jgi:hypothetical protein
MMRMRKSLFLSWQITSIIIATSNFLVRLVSSQEEEETYRVNYKGRFQWFHAGLCEGPIPVLYAFCHGQLEDVAVSDASIQCNSISTTNVSTAAAAMATASSGIECINTCGVDPPCDEVYDETGFSPLDEGIFGEIFFACSGTTIEDVVATFVFGEEEEEGSCRGSFLSTGWNFHATQLGVYCNDNNNDDDDPFRHDDYYTSCLSGNAYYDSTVGIIKQPSLSFSIPFGEEIHYTCVNGKDCGENDCEFNFSPVMMQTKLANLVQSPECITTTITTTDSVTTTMENIDPWNHTTSGTADVQQEGIYTTRFQARWDLAKDLSFGNAEMDRFTIVLTCTTEGSTIALIATDPDDMMIIIPPVCLEMRIMIPQWELLNNPP